MTTATLIKKNLIVVAHLQFRGSVHICGEHCGMQTGMVLEKYLSVLYLEGNRKSTLGSILSIRNLKVCPHSDTLPVIRPYLLQQRHTS